VTRTPLLIVGDGPNEPSGLGRIARDLASLIVSSDLPLDVVSCGGPSLPVWRDWLHVPMGEIERNGDWGRSFIEAAWLHVFGRRPGILWIIWDPGRLAAYDGIDLPVQVWSYPAVDGDNTCGAIGGPAAAALLHADRVIAYGRWGSQILHNTIGRSVPYLPHGVQTRLYMEEETDDERAWVEAELGPHVKRNDAIVGCVATNQPRKDLGLYFRTLRGLLDRGHKVYGWLHTDVLTKAWSVVQLAEDCGLARKVTVSTKAYTDRELALLYRRCSVTVAPGLGEGFGYPIVESLASGVPVVHGDFAGGRELVPKREWRFPVREIRLEGIYGQRRPVFRPEDVANAIERVWRWRSELPIEAVQAYCQGSVAHLDWSSLWPRWRSWIRQGVEG
jgi:glycosyltransferase involved in cell wall biosynthesis